MISSLNFFSLYKYSGIIKSNIDHSSINEFSIGVPVNANLTLDFISLTDFALMKLDF